MSHPASVDVVRTDVSFVGRETELDELCSQLLVALRGKPEIVLLSGEMGIGKTRLLGELGRLAQRLGFKTVQGSALEFSRTPYLPFRAVLETCVPSASQDPHGTGFLRALHEGSAQPSTSVPPEASYDYVRSFLSLIRRVVAYARREPLLIVLDDMHWADAPSLELLAQLLFAVMDMAEDERVPLMVAVAHRPVAPGHALLKLIERLRRELKLNELTLSGLNSNETALLLRGLGVVRASHPLVDAVQRLTHGYPLFVREVLDQLDRRGLLEHNGDAITVRDRALSEQLPLDVSSALCQRLEGLPARDLESLAAGALSGETFTLERLAHLTASELEPLRATLSRAQGAGIVTAEGEVFRFGHPLVRKLLVGRLGADRLVALHIRIARALAAHPGSGALSLEIAQHLASAPESDLALLRDHARRGADHAFRVFDYGQAARMYGTAAQCAEKITGTPASELAELHFLSGRAYQHDYDYAACLAQYESALGAFIEAQDLRGQAQVLREKARVLITAATSYGQRIDLTEQERVLRELQDGEPLVRGLLLEVMSQVHWTSRNTERAKQLARESLALADRLDDDRLRHYASFSLGLAQFQAGELSESLASYRRSLDCALRTGDAWIRLPPLQRIAVLLIASGELTEAERISREARAQAVEVGRSAEASFAQANLASVALCRAAFEDVEIHARESVALGQRARYPWGAMIGLLSLASARTLTRRYEDALHAIELLGTPGDVFDAPGPPIQLTIAAFRCYLAVETDDAEALAHARTVLPNLVQLLSVSPFDANSAGVLCLLALSAVRLGWLELAQAMHTPLERLAERGMLLTNGTVFLLPRVLGRICALLGRIEQADTYLSQAVERAEQCGAQLELALSLRDRAEWLTTRGVGAAGENARLSARADALFSQLGLGPRSSEAADGQASAEEERFDARERHLLRRLAQGRTLQDVAAELLLAPASAAILAERVFAKIGGRGAGLATAYALAHGLLGRDHLAVSGPTVLVVTDMVDFTGMVQRLGDLRARAVMHRHNRIVRELLAAYRGSEVTHTGDGLMISFASGADASQCAMAIQQALARDHAAHPESEIRVRIGINAGQLLPEEDRLFGAALIAAVRVCACAGPGQILLSSEALRALAQPERVHARPVGRVQLKGFRDEVDLYELPWR